MPKTVKVAVARHGARADDDPNWTLRADACPWNPPLSKEGREQASSLGDYAVSLGIRRLAVSPFARCLQTAAAVARKILEADERKERGVAGAGDGGASPALRPLVVEIDCSLCEVLSRECMGGEDPEGGADPTLWAWNGGGGDGEGGGGSLSPPLLPLLSAAASSSGLRRELTSVVSRSSFPSYPETTREARSRYFRALSEAAARALVGVSPPTSTTTADASQVEKGGSSSTVAVMAITHGEAVSAASSMASGGRRPFAVPPTGVVVLEATVDDDDDGDGDDALVASASSSLACARWELVEAARGVAFER